MDRCDVAIIGAGPYGLSIAAHLRQIQGLDVRMLGEPMSFWERYMPEGMRLRSPWAASNISDPDGRFSLDTYRAASDRRTLGYPIPVSEFITYGRWVSDRLNLPLQRSNVRRIELDRGGYLLALDDDTTLRARRVVVACGIQPFKYRPPMFEGLPGDLVSHTSERREYNAFRDKNVLVIGAGQSALEAAGFLNRAGARAEVLIRNPGVHWLGRRPWMKSKAFGWIFYGRGDIGPAFVSHVVQHPHLFRRLPRALQSWWGPRSIRPAVLDRLTPEMLNVPIRTERFPVAAKAEGDRLRVRLNDGTDRVVNHVVLGTGYRVNITRYPFFTAALCDRIAQTDGYPRLDLGFETTLPGLHIVGAPAAWSFGPLMRFVAGAEFTSRTVARRIASAPSRSGVNVPELQMIPEQPGSSADRLSTV
jgi:lysine/ornithine N-monooxygenase